MKDLLEPWDYAICACTLLLSSGIGFYFAWKSRKQETSADYLVANRSMHWIPTCISMVASLFSAIGIIGIPANVYTTGVTFIFFGCSFILTSIVTAEFFVPLFRRLELVSINQYLELRFNFSVRLLGHIMFIIQYFLYLSVATYAPALALHSVSGLSLTGAIISVGAVCTLYTSIGGMKAVIWTDVFQSGVMFSGLLVIVGMGLNEIGFAKIVQINREWGRLSFETSLHPQTYHSVWNMLFGMAFSFIGNTCSQVNMQRIAATRSAKHATWALYVSGFASSVIVAVLTLSALTMFALDYECDLIYDKKISSYDQVLPYFVITKLRKFKGVPGLFTACLFSFALSTLSSGMNAMSALFLKDVLDKTHPNISLKNSLRATKLFAVTSGVLVTIFSFVIPKLGKYLTKIAIQIFGIIGGPQWAMIAMGYFSSKVNPTGAIVGTLVSFATGLFFTIGQLVYPPDKHLPPILVRGCKNFNATIQQGVIYPRAPYHNNWLASVLSVSYAWHAAISIIVCCVVTYIVSLCTATPGYEETIKKELLYYYEENFFYKRFLSYKRRKNKTAEEVKTYEKNVETTNM